MSFPDKSLHYEYDTEYRVSDAERARLPDTQNADRSMIKGAPVAVQQVGASNFRLPMNIVREDGSTERLETAVTGTVQLEEGIRGINMSRIMRAFYEYREKPVTLSNLEVILERIRVEVDSRRSYLRLAFSYPILMASLRSDLQGYQYYDVTYEGRLSDEGYRSRMGVDFVYSSACPGSAELAEHARMERDAYTIPHSQRSVARITIEPSPGSGLSIEALQLLCREALQTEVQVMVRREDEQAFAELNGAHPKFVEDAARLLFGKLDLLEQVRDFRIVCTHLESLHAHDAVAVAIKGIPGGLTAEVENFQDLVR